MIHAPVATTLTLVTLALLAACSATPPEQPHTADEGQPMMILAEWRGTQSDVEQPGFEVIRDDESWQRAWERTGVEEDPPEIDFTQQMALVAWMGQRPTGGYAIRIRDIREAGDAYEAVIHRQAPGDDAFVTQALTSPYHIAIIPRTQKPVRPAE